MKIPLLARADHPDRDGRDRAARLLAADRAHQKEALNAHIVAFESAPAQRVGATPIPLKDIEFHRVMARGTFMPDKVIYLDNRPYNDQPGFTSVMPFRLAGGGVVLVNRGWLPRNLSNRTGIEPYETPDHEIEIEGVARANASQAFELGRGGSAAGLQIRQNLDVAAYARETGLPLQPFVIQQQSDSGDKLVRDWPAPTLGVDTNTTATCSSGGAWPPPRSGLACTRRGGRRKWRQRKTVLVMPEAK